jgi:hypothetical protein
MHACRYIVCVFVPVVTGSGKTHTMEGPAEDPGINFRAMKELFRVIHAERKASHRHEINASIVEIYNEQVCWPATLRGWLLPTVGCGYSGGGCR